MPAFPRRYRQQARRQSVESAVALLQCAGTPAVATLLTGLSQVADRLGREICPVFQGFCHLTQLGLIRGVGVNGGIQDRTT